MSVGVSVVVPTRNEAVYLPATLESLTAQQTARSYEVVVADGGSTDGTIEIAESFGVEVIDDGGRTIADGRNAGATATDGEWLAFVDADTTVVSDYLETMVDFAERRGLAAASSRCRIEGPRRARLMEWTINYVFPRLETPILPGFNTVVRRKAFERVGGFPSVPNEDTAFSRRLGRIAPTGYCPERLVCTSGRRITETGLSGTLYHYLRLDWERVREGADFT